MVAARMSAGLSRALTVGLGCTIRAPRRRRHRRRRRERRWKRWRPRTARRIRPSPDSNAGRSGSPRSCSSPSPTWRRRSPRPSRIGAATLFAGGNTPLAVVFALVAALFTAYSIGQLARHLPSAGGMYTYVTRGLGSFFGWLMAWAFTPRRAGRPGGAVRLIRVVRGVVHHAADRVLQRLLWLPLAVLCGLVVWWLDLSRHRDLDPRSASSWA